MAELEPISIQQLVRASGNANALDVFVNANASTMVFRPAAEPIETLEYWRNYMSALATGKNGVDGIDAAITSMTVITGAAGTAASVVTGGTPTARTFALTIPRGDKGADGSFTQKSYTTYALMDADKVNIPANTSVIVTNDTDSTKNGMYAYNGTVFTKSAYDPLMQAKVYSDTKDVELKTQIQNIISSADFIAGGLINKISGVFNSATGYSYTDFIAVIPNQLYKILAAGVGNTGSAWYNKDKQFISAFTPYTLTEVVSPSNAYYVRLSCTAANAVNATLSTNYHRKIEDLKNVIYTHVGVQRSTTDTNVKSILQDDAVRYEKRVNSVAELNNINPAMIGEKAYPIGRKIYDHSLRKEIIADGVSWRLPDGSPASLAENRVYVYPDWHETKKALPNFAKTFHKLFSVVSSVPSELKTNINSSVSYTDFYKEKRLSLSSFNGAIAEAVISIDGTKLSSFLVLDFYGSYLNANGIAFIFYAADKTVVGSVGAAATSTSLDSFDAKKFELGYDYVKQLIPLATIANRSTITHMGIKLISHGNVTANIHMSDIDTVSFKPKMTLRFDDSLKSIYNTAFPILTANGLKGLSAVVTGRVAESNPDYMSVAQLKEIQAAGWDLVSHTENHVDVDASMNDHVRLRSEYKNSQDFLRDVLGTGMIASSCHISPQARMNDTAMAIQREFYDCQINGAFINTPMPDQPGGSAGGSAGNWMRLGGMNGDNKSDAAPLIAMAEQVIASEGWGIMMMHDITPTAATYRTSIAALTGFCEWLAANTDRIAVVTVTDMVKQVRPNAS